MIPLDPITQYLFAGGVLVVQIAKAFVMVTACFRTDVRPFATRLLRIRRGRRR